eukprot:TRINITY_DN4330_c0_g1_i7.p2 TRINITY_DN4330_c0_g1~~TRINITY_DN4330_c0_g1_i7.p2  ORF type:complete len:134 (-),score=26.79 TRINITY_DN4330_c0_g1_i7:173-529(-)
MISKACKLLLLTVARGKAEADNIWAEPLRRLWVCPQGFVGKDQCDSSQWASDCCGYSVPGENCGNRDDCFCYQWNCDDRRLQEGEDEEGEGTSTAAPTAVPTAAASGVDDEEDREEQG